MEDYMNTTSSLASVGKNFGCGGGGTKAYNNLHTFMQRNIYKTTNKKAINK